MRSKIFLLLIAMFLEVNICYARQCKILNTEWGDLCNILQKRVEQHQPKMKLSEDSAVGLEMFLLTTTSSFDNLKKLKTILPKTTVELLMSVAFRNVKVEDAEAIARYLKNMLIIYDFQNVTAFDENTSHIIGRDWSEIDYSNEAMTSETQEKKYKKYSITNFKTIENIERFFPVESKLPYFKKIYKPRNLL